MEDHDGRLIPTVSAHSPGGGGVERGGRAGGIGMRETCPYRILEVAEDCSDETIVAVYRHLVKIHHPDKGGSRERFQLIQDAYELLHDKQVRRTGPSGAVGENETRTGDCNLGESEAGFGRTNETD
jgi:curved DNA-binding protein CbpA